MSVSVCRWPRGLSVSINDLVGVVVGEQIVKLWVYVAINTCNHSPPPLGQAWRVRLVANPVGGGYDYGRSVTSPSSHHWGSPWFRPAAMAVAVSLHEVSSVSTR